MRIVNDLEQGSQEWLNVRLGKATASNFDKLITSTGKRSATLPKYAMTLASNTILAQKGIQPEESFQTPWMARGNELEPQAREWYEFQTDQQVVEVGFICSDNDQYGCSPDGLTADGGLELKCPKIETHLGYLLGQKVPTVYKAQVQGSMWVAERDHWDFASFHPDLSPFLIRVDRDQGFIDALAGYVQEVTDLKLDILEQYKKLER